MKILVDVMPKRYSECLFVNINVYGDVQCEIMQNHKCYGVDNCPYLKEHKHIEDDCR